MICYFSTIIPFAGKIFSSLNAVSKSFCTRIAQSMKAISPVSR